MYKKYQFTKNKTKYLRFLLLWMLAFSAICKVDVASASKITLGFASGTWPGFAPFWVAQDKKLFRKVNLKFVEGDNRDSLLLANRVAMANLSMNVIVKNYATGHPTPIVMPMDYSYGADGIISAKQITKLSQLKGKTVALSMESPSMLLLAYVLKKSNLSLKDVDLVDMQGSSVPSAMLSGSVKVGVTWAPNIEMALNNDKSLHILYTTRQAPGVISDNIVFAPGFASKNPELVKDVINGFLEGQKYIKDHPKSAYKIMAHYMGVTSSAAKTMYSGLISPGACEMMKMYDEKTGTLSYAYNLRIALEVMKYEKKVPDSFELAPDQVLEKKWVSAKCGS